MAEEKKPAEQESAKTTAKPAARKKTTAAKAPAKTVQRVRKSAKTVSYTHLDVYKRQKQHLKKLTVVGLCGNIRQEPTRIKRFVLRIQGGKKDAKRIRNQKRDV